MSSEDTLIQIRKDKHSEINGSCYPLASHYNYNDNLRNIHFYIGALGKSAKTTVNLDDLTGYRNFVLYGRITAFRKAGSITFIKITDSTGSMQLVISRSSYSDYDSLKFLDLGDIIEASGKPCLTKTGERSILVSECKLLTKAYRPPPEKFAGLSDQEIKVRKRYLDLMSSEETRARFIIRTYIIRAIRHYMEYNDFLEVETSTLNSISSGANAKPFTTHHNALDMNLFLRIAPELYLKRLLVGGLDRVFEIGRNYRNEGIDTKHNPEFTMMEFYMSYGRFSDLLTMTKALLRYVNTYCQQHLPSNIRTYYQSWQDSSPFSFTNFVEVPMKRAVIDGLFKASYTIGDDYLTPVMLSGSSEKNDLRRKLIDFTELSKQLKMASSIGERISILFENVSEPFLADDYRSDDKLQSLPVFITEYPKDICPLARASDQDPSVCDRFELFIEGRELCNAFQELNDPTEQAIRFEEQLKNNSKDPMDYDIDYVNALEHGMPPAIGFGMGIDRLVMLLTNSNSIRDVILFPTLRNL